MRPGSRRWSRRMAPYAPASFTPLSGTYASNRSIGSCGKISRGSGGGSKSRRTRSASAASARFVFAWEEHFEPRDGSSGRDAACLRPRGPNLSRRERPESGDPQDEAPHHRGPHLAARSWVPSPRSGMRPRSRRRASRPGRLRSRRHRLVSVDGGRSIAPDRVLGARLSGASSESRNPRARPALGGLVRRRVLQPGTSQLRSGPERRRSIHRGEAEAERDFRGVDHRPRLSLGDRALLCPEGLEEASSSFLARFHPGAVLRAHGMDPVLHAGRGGKDFSRGGTRARDPAVARTPRASSLSRGLLLAAPASAPRPRERGRSNRVSPRPPAVGRPLSHRDEEAMIVLYNPLAPTRGKQALQLSLLSLAAVLEGRERYRLVDGNLERDPAGAIVEILKTAPRSEVTLLAVTVMPGPQLMEAVPVTKRVRELVPDVPIVWGGYFPTQHGATVLKSSYVDFVVRSQGEAALLKPIEVLRSGGSFADIPSLSWKDARGIHENPLGPATPLDELPELPYHRVDMADYIHTDYLGSRTAVHHSSFGCPFACNFCAVVAMSNRRWLAQSPARLERVVRQLVADYGVDAVMMHDMDFFISETRVAEFAERIAGLGVSWWGLGRIDTLMRYSDATWRSMARSGLRMVFSGAESASDEALRAMNKGGTSSAQLAIDLARRMRGFGVVPE